MKLAKDVKLQLKLKTTRQGTTLESTQAPMAPTEARAYWQEVADHAQRLALQDVTESPQPEPLPVTLPPDGGLLRSLRKAEAAGLVVDV